MIEDLFGAILVILLASGMFATITNQTTGQTLGPGITRDFPYHQTPNTSSCGNSFASVNTGFASTDNVNAVGDTDFTGKTVTNIGVYLCAIGIAANGQNTGACPVSSNSSVTIGVFSQSTQSLLKGFGTIPLKSLPCTTGNNNNGKEIAFTGSYLMTADSIIGVTFTSTTDAAKTLCGGACTSTDLVHGSTYDCKASCVPTVGFALGGDFLGPASNPNVTSSPGYVTAIILIPLFFGGLVLIGIWTDYAQKYAKGF